MHAVNQRIQSLLCSVGNIHNVIIHSIQHSRPNHLITAVMTITHHNTDVVIYIFISPKNRQQLHRRRHMVFLWGHYTC